MSNVILVIKQNLNHTTIFVHKEQVAIVKLLN